MANKPLEEIKSDFLNCQICMEDCVNPKLLQCLHFFCEQCLGKWKRNRRIECPTCREVTHLRNGSTSSLKSMFFVSSMIEAIKGKLAESGDTGKASGSGKNKFTDERCCVHGERLNFYCKKCSKPVCRDCIVLDHPRPLHECVNLSEAAEKARLDIEQGMEKIVTIQKQLTLVECALKSGEEDVSASTAVARVELKKMNDALMKEIRSKHDGKMLEIQDLANKKKSAISEKLSEIAVSNEALSKLAVFLSNLQLNGKDYDLAHSHADVLKKTKEISSAVDVPQVPEEPRKIEFKPNMVCVERAQGEFMTLGSVLDQKIDVKVEVRGPSQMPQEQQKFLMDVIREAYTMEVEDQPHTTPETYKQLMAENPGESLNFRRANYIGQKMDDKYGQFWACVIGDFSCRYPYNEYLAEVFTVDDCEKILVYKKPTGSHLINLAKFEPKVILSNGDVGFDTRVCRLVSQALQNCASSDQLCKSLRLRLMQSFRGKWHVIFACNFQKDDYFEELLSIYVMLQVADEKLFIFRV